MSKYYTLIGISGEYWFKDPSYRTLHRVYGPALILAWWVEELVSK